MNANDSRHHLDRKARIQARLDAAPDWTLTPVMAGGGARYEVGDRVTVLAPGGIGLVHQLVESIGLAACIDDHLRLFKRHFPYHESDHVLNLAYNVMAGGTCLEDL